MVFFTCVRFAQHLEEKEDVRYKMGDLHAAFMNECIAEGVPGVEDILFRKVCIWLQENSVLFG